MPYRPGSGLQPGQDLRRNRHRHPRPHFTITHVDGYETSTLKVPLPAQVGKPVSDASLKDGLLMQNFEPRPEQDPVAVKVVAR